MRGQLGLLASAAHKSVALYETTPNQVQSPTAAIHWVRKLPRMSAQAPTDLMLDKGKAERFRPNELTRVGLCPRLRSSDERTAELPRWLHSYNWHRPHELGSKPTITPLALDRNNLLKLHS